MNKKYRLGSSVLGACLISATSGVLAQSDTPANDIKNSEMIAGSTYMIEEVIVTANRREESIQDVAASISVVGGKTLERSGIFNSNDIGQVIPNVTITSTFNNSNPRIFIRGVGSADFNPNASSPIGVYVDDVYLASTNLLQFQLYDLDRVEVLRGPQGTLYGRNTTGGAIKYISNQPTDEFEAEGTLRAGNLDERAVQGAISGALSENGVSARLAFNAEKRDGNTENRLTGNDSGNDIKSWGARVLLSYEANPDLRFLLNVHGGHANPHTVVYKPRGTMTPDGEPCATGAALKFQCSDVLGYSDNHDLYSVANNVVGREKVKPFGGSLEIENHFDLGTFTSITAADTVDLQRTEDSDGSPNQLLEITYADKSKQFSQEFRLSSVGGETLNWIVGAYYLYEDVKYDNQYDVLRSLRPVFGFDPGNFVVLADQNVKQNGKSGAVFGRLDYALTGKVKLTAGLRYTYEEQTFSESVALTEPEFTVPLFTVHDDRNDSKFTGDVILDYQLNEEVMLYTSVSQGFRSGGFNGGIVFDPEEVTAFGPETLTSYEIGFKSQAEDGRWTLNSSAFFYQYDDLQVYTLINPPSGGVPIQILDNASDAQVYGMEADGSFAITYEVRITASLGLLETEFKDYQSIAADQSYSGNRFGRAPETTASIGLSLNQPLSNGFEVFGNLDAAFRDQFYFDATNSDRLEQDGYWLVNARLGFGPEDGKWSVSIWGKNIFDEEYYRDIIDLSQFGFYGPTVW